jgi:hypothetical protein
MATDLLGPNDWGKLPPEQLWNVLKVQHGHVAGEFTAAGLVLCLEGLSQIY